LPQAEGCSRNENYHYHQLIVDNFKLHLLTLNFDTMPTVYNAVKEVPKTDEEAALNQEPVLSEPMNAKKGLVIAVSGSCD